jgi:hypothetical protein
MTILRRHLEDEFEALHGSFRMNSSGSYSMIFIIATTSLVLCNTLPGFPHLPSTSKTSSSSSLTCVLDQLLFPTRCVASTSLLYRGLYVSSSGNNGSTRRVSSSPRFSYSTGRTQGTGQEAGLPRRHSPYLHVRCMTFSLSNWRSLGEGCFAYHTTLHMN